MRWGFGVTAVVAAALLAGCSSSSPSPAPTSSAPVSVPVTTSAAPTPTPTPTPSPTKTTPLSPYEQDPAVQALRAWASQAGRTVNTGKYDDAALNALMTPALAKSMKLLAGPEVGRRYPGPLPFTPVKVTVVSSTQRDVSICVVDNGFSLDPKTGKPAKHHVEPIDSGAVKRHGQWLVSSFAGPGKFSCAGVKIKEQKW